MLKISPFGIIKLWVTTIIFKARSLQLATNYIHYCYYTCEIFQFIKRWINNATFSHLKTIWISIFSPKKRRKVLLKMFFFWKSLSYKYVNIRETKWNYCLYLFRTRVMVLSTNFNNISVISWRSVLLVEETGVHGKNHRPAASHLQPLSHYVELSTPRHERDSNSQL